jgi:hypothetical protein
MTSSTVQENISKRPILTRYLRRMAGGVHRPPLFQASDGRRYVLKLPNEEPAFPVAELVCAELARTMGVAMPFHELLVVPPGLPDALQMGDADAEQVGFALSEGQVCFGVEFESDARLWQVTDEKDVSLVALFLFDLLIENMDRTPENPNLLNTQRGFLAIDHGQALPAVLGLPSFPSCPFPSERHLAFDLVEDSPFLLAHGQKWWSLLTSEVVGEAVDRVPQEWWVSSSCASFVQKCILERANILCSTPVIELVRR